MSGFELQKSFGIDHGELDGLSAQQCFVLGYELAQVERLLSQDTSIRKPINADNRLRIEAACRESGRKYQISWMPGDQSESWMLLDAPRNDNK